MANLILAAAIAIAGASTGSHADSKLFASRPPITAGTWIYGSTGRLWVDTIDLGPSTAGPSPVQQQSLAPAATHYFPSTQQHIDHYGW